MIRLGAPGFEDALRDALTVRRPSSDDELAQLIEQALWDAKGDEATASVLAAEAIRDAGWRLWVDRPTEAAYRAALGDVAEMDAGKRALYHVVIGRARALDDPENARNTKQLWDVLRQAHADMSAEGGADEAAAIMAALRGTEGD